MRFHTNLPVRNIAKTVEFYSTLFGSAPEKVKSDYAKFLPEGDGLNISFHQTAEGAGDLARLHIGFELPDLKTLDESYARLQAAGLVSSSRETSICCYANQDKFWVKDPDGYQWELYVLLEDTPSKMEKKPSCCGGAKSAPQVGGPCC